MKISLAKNVFDDIDINDANLAGVYDLKPIRGEGLSDDQIKEAITNPIGTRPLRQAARGCTNVLIVTDDITRATPLTRLVTPLLDELRQAGVNDEQITFLIGLGSHRALDADEIRNKFGDELPAKYKIVNHCWNDSTQLVSLGNCDLGFEVVINKLAADADLIISIGSIVPHATTGFSGGAKTLMTGIAGERTIENTHWMALDYSMPEILGNYDNAVLKTINQLASRVKLAMIINTVLFDHDKIYALVAGDLNSAYKKGVEHCRQLYGVPIGQKTDIVIAEAYPADVNLRQAIKAICAADLVCRDGGVVILAAECPEGVAQQFPDFCKFGFKNPDALYRRVNDGTFTDKLMAYTLVAIGRIISARLQAILVCPNIAQAQAEHMGFIWAPSLNDALEKAFCLKDSRAKVMILKKASVILPVLPSETT